jgi:hypothetical protein
MTVRGPYEKPHYYIGLSTDTKPSAMVGDEFFETNTKLWYIYNGSTWSQKPASGGGSGSLSFTSATDPATNAATTTAIIDAYGGIVITTSTTGNSQTLSDPTITSVKTFTVVVLSTSTNSVPVVANSVTYTVTPGEAQSFIWDGTEWGPIDLGITSIPVPVSQGGTGASSASITAFNNITGFTASGTTGTTSTNLVFSTSPALTTPNIGTPSAGTLTSCTGLPLAGIVVGTAESDFIVAGASPFTRLNKTLAETKTILGVHTQNTDTGTTSETFQLFSGSSGVKLKGGTIELGIRNAGDTSYVALGVSTVGIYSAAGANKSILTSLASTDRSVVYPDAAGTVYLVGQALGTPASGTLTSCTGLPASGIVTGILPENSTIGLVTTLSADTKWSGISEVGIAGTTALVYGYVYYLDTATSEWELTNATAAATSSHKLGICIGAAAHGAAGLLLLWGKIRADDEFPAMTVGTQVYLSKDTAGFVTSTAPTGTTNFVVRVVGFADTADELFFCPSNDYIELA